MKNNFSGNITLVPGVRKNDGAEVLYFNKATAAATNRTEVIDGDCSAVVEKALEHGGERLLNISGKDIGAPNYHTVEEATTLSKKHQAMAFEGSRGSVYLSFRPAAVKPAKAAKGKKVIVDKNAITF